MTWIKTTNAPSVFNDEIYYGQNETDYWTGPIEPCNIPTGPSLATAMCFPTTFAVLYHFHYCRCT